MKFQHNRTQWQIIFAIAAVIFFLGNLVYIIWGTSETQSWNSIDFQQHEKDLEKSVEKQTTIEKKVEQSTKHEKKEKENGGIGNVVERTRL